MRTFLLALAAFALSSCGAAAGGGGGGPAATIGGTCTPTSQTDACGKDGTVSVHLHCGADAKVWAVAETCVEGSQCQPVSSGGVTSFVCTGKTATTM